MSNVHAPLARTRSGLLHALMILTLAFAALAASGVARADPPGRVGRLGDMQGTVWLYDDYDGEWVQARRNRPVTEGDRVSTERGARAEIQIGSATLRLDGATDVEFPEMNDERVRVRLHGGTVALRTRGDSSREFSILTPEGRFEPTRAGRYRVDRRDDSSYATASSGTLYFEANDSALEINAGQRAELWLEGGVTHYAWAAMPDDRFGEWVARQDREDDRDRERRRYVSPEMTGSEDLDRYGAWDRHPEYGAIWYPTTVVAGWAPYRYGYWAFVQPWGWTWVDDAPWGFAPFHYGRWVNWGGRWGWCPGQYVARPVYAPALVAWFGGPHVSVGISVGGGPAVGWVPLAPREYYYPSYQVTNIYIRNVNVTHQPWLPKAPPGRAVPTGPVMYTNQGVAGGVTVVSHDVLRNRQPISNSVVVPVDARTVSKWQEAGRQVVQQQNPPRGADNRAQAPVMNVAPPAPPSRVVAVPGGAVPAAPGAVRNVPWSSAARAATGRSDGGEAGPRGRATPPTVQRSQSPAAVERVTPPGATPPAAQQGTPQRPPTVQQPQPPAAQQPAPQRPPTVQQPVPPRVERSDRAERERPPGNERRAAPQAPMQPQPQAPTQPQVQGRPGPAAVRAMPPQPVPGKGHAEAREEGRGEQRQQQRGDPRSEEQRRRGVEPPRQQQDR